MTAEQLKASLLQMAIQGKLVPQLDDEPAVDIDAEEPEDVPFAIPEKWKWVRLKDIGFTQTGTTPPTSDQTYYGSDIPFIKPGDIINDTVIYREYGLSNKGAQVGRLADCNSILMVCIGGSIGKVCLIKKKASFNQQINSITPEKNIAISDYVFYVLLSNYFYKSVWYHASGTATPIIKKSSWENIPLPIPPVAEQRRIVARLNELLSIVEEYGKSQSGLHALETELPGKLRASLLQQAIMGKLVPQLDDEPAVDIDAEELEEVPFAIPEKWKWVKIKNLVTPCEQKIPDRDFLYIDVSSIDNICHKLKNSLKILQPHKAPSRARKIVKQGMVLYSTVRPYLLNTCIIEDKHYDEMICSTAFIAVSCSDKLMSHYFLLFLLSPYFISYVSYAQKGIAYPAITDKNFYDALIPVPPIDEQCRIIAHMNEILPFFNAMVKS